MWKKIMVFVFVWILGFSLGSMAVAKEVEVRLAGITMTSDTYMLGVGWSNVIKKYLPDVSMKVLAEGGTTKLLRGVVNKQWEIGYIGTAHLECARKGILLMIRLEFYLQSTADGAITWCVRIPGLRKLPI